ncbi:hypothetical protein M426DRAFT_320094 [Hypoxylon sp. CI-4A]|nr:hypothetical protein M426DRAFT_320094 [Hypoxylon sp. CI-4A]
MATYTLEIPGEYGYVLLVAASSLLVNTFHGALTGKARKASGLAYPIPYASQELADKDPKAYTFNCAQRAHSNYTENLTPFLGALLISGFNFPLTSAVLGGIWTFGRVGYAYGYVSGGPKGRLRSFYMAALSDFALKGLSIFTAVKMLPIW